MLAWPPDDACREPNSLPTSQIRAHNLDPALEWARAHRRQLSPDGGPSAFEFRLHSLAFVHTLLSQGEGATREGEVGGARLGLVWGKRWGEVFEGQPTVPAPPALRPAP
jgi:hypothetical protein